MEEDTFYLVDKSDEIITEGGQNGLLIFNEGTVCDDGFNEYAAEAICRQLGFNGAQYWSSGAFWSPDELTEEDYDLYISTPITLDDVNCNGYDWNNDCTFQRTHNCGHSEDIQLVCSGMLVLVRVQSVSTYC